MAPQRQGNLMAPEDWHREVPAAEHGNIPDREAGPEAREHRARQPGRRERQAMPREQRVQELNAAQARLARNEGGNPQTKLKHERWRFLYEEAMEELGVQRGGWYQFDVELFRRFAAWALASCDLALLDVFQTMLNKEHRARFRSGLSPWNGDVSILEIKRSYEVSRAEMRKERQIADAEAGVAPVTRAVRVSFSDDFLGRVIVAGERVYMEEEIPGVAARRRLLAVAAWVLLMVLFAVRVSSLGALTEMGDVYVQDSGGGKRLCLTIRHIKWWIAGKQRQTGRSLPLVREGRHGVPFDELGTSWRDRAVRVIMKAVHADVILLGTEKGWVGASAVFNKALKRYLPLPEEEGRLSTSHSGRKTCAVVASASGVGVEVLREWMLVLDAATVDVYAKREANEMPGPIAKSLLGFLLNKV